MGDDEQCIIVKWMTLNCSSNSELATLSNVSRSWRKIVSETLIHLHNQSESNSKQYPVENLLLPCMAKELSAQRKKQLIDSNNDVVDSKEVDENSTFCLAWFAPKGIQIDSVSLNDDDSSSDSSSESLDKERNNNGSKYNHDHDIATRFSYTKKNWKMLTATAKLPYTSSPLISSSNHGLAGETMNRSRRFGMALGSDAGTRNDKISARKTIAKAWLGYKNAMDILIPFGYTNDFARQILKNAIPNNHKPEPTNTSVVLSTSPTTEVTSTAITNSSPNNISQIDTATTFAVRGAVEAKPEGIPWGDTFLFQKNFLRDLKNRINTNNEMEVTSDMNDYKSKRMKDENTGIIDNNATFIDNNDVHKKQEYYEALARLKYQQDYDKSRNKLKIKKIKKKIKEMKLLLPRIILSTNEKNKRLYQNDQNYENMNGSLFMREKRRRSVQFLNVDDSRAVRMQTRPFACGSVLTPITVFCVGIATEDGSFMSGLNRRLELGHLHPQTARDAMIDMSSICIGMATVEENGKGHLNDYGDVARDSKGLESKTSVAATAFQDLCYAMSQEKEAAKEKNVDCNSVSNSSSWAEESNEDDSSFSRHSESQNGPPLIVRGKTGPGRWHCYTAIFDGEESILRVDGLMEQEEGNNESYGSKLKESSSLKPQKSTIVKRALLDGLTLGSDHCFDMSLCYGGGDDGEGEGAISEIAVFKGRLSIEDLLAMETYLMNKHGINKANAPNERTEKTKISSWQEDEWVRHAHALIVQPPPFNYVGDPVPLHVLANHRSVAWHRKNDVTGAVMRVSRIGSKYSNGSSDW